MKGSVCIQTSRKSCINKKKVSSVLRCYPSEYVGGENPGEMRPRKPLMISVGTLYIIQPLQKRMGSLQIREGQRIAFCFLSFKKIFFAQFQVCDTIKTFINCPSTTWYFSQVLHIGDFWEINAKHGIFFLSFFLRLSPSFY